MVRENKIFNPTRCPMCGEEVKNQNVNYCLKCGNMLCSKGFTSRTRLIR